MQTVMQTYLTVVSCFEVTACRLFLLRELLMTPMEQVADKPVVRCQGGCREDTRNKWEHLSPHLSPRADCTASRVCTVVFMRPTEWVVLQTGKPSH